VIPIRLTLGPGITNSLTEGNREDLSEELRCDVRANNRATYPLNLVRTEAQAILHGTVHDDCQGLGAIDPEPRLFGGYGRLGSAAKQPMTMTLMDRLAWLSRRCWHPR
jgi:hypothetical protein